jgi:hypothetical protein
VDSEAEVLGTITRKRREGGIDLGDEKARLSEFRIASLRSTANFANRCPLISKSTQLIWHDELFRLDHALSWVIDGGAPSVFSRQARQQKRGLSHGASCL